MGTIDKLKEELLNARKSGDSEKADILRVVLADIKNQEIEKGESLSEEEVVIALRKNIKKVQDSIDSFMQAGKEDLAEVERKQKKILEGFVPALMDKDQIKNEVVAVVDEMGAVTMRDFGKVMQLVMKKLQGKADGSSVSEVVKEVLASK